jgi:putative ABC transport system permease protein
MAREIAALPGVARVQALRNARVTFQGRPTMVVAMEMRSIAQTVKVRPVAGNSADMYRRAAAGQGLIISDNLSQLRHIGLGDLLEIPAPYGLVRLPVVGIVVDYSDQQGSILIDRALFRRYWRDDSVNMFRVYDRPGVADAAVRQRIVDLYGGKRQVFVLTNAELRSYITSVAGNWFQLTSAQIAVAVLVAILGIVNALTVSILDRRRELAVLQAVGGARRQVRATVWLEAASLACIGLVLGYVLGAVNLFYTLEIVRRDIAGLRLDYVFPVGTALILVPIIVTAGFGAAIWPAESAVRASLVEALEYE